MAQRHKILPHHNWLEESEEGRPKENQALKRRKTAEKEAQPQKTTKGKRTDILFQSLPLNQPLDTNSTSHDFQKHDD